MFGLVCCRVIVIHMHTCTHAYAHMHVHTTLIIVWLPAWSYVVLCIFRQGYSTTDGAGADESPDEPNWGEGEPHSPGQDGYPCAPSIWRGAAPGQHAGRGQLGGHAQGTGQCRRTILGMYVPKTQSAWLSISCNDMETKNWCSFVSCA